jgi:hypothetical protein
MKLYKDVPYRNMKPITSKYSDKRKERLYLFEKYEGENVIFAVVQIGSFYENLLDTFNNYEDAEDYLNGE